MESHESRPSDVNVTLDSFRPGGGTAPAGAEAPLTANGMRAAAMANERSRQMGVLLIEN
jgi:hypothetical protein